jgi:parallel beta helix pectate lyase-like protein
MVFILAGWHSTRPIDPQNRNYLFRGLGLSRGLGTNRMSNVQHFGAVGDGKTDDTVAIAHAVAEGDGLLEFPRGDYLLTGSINIPLDSCGRTAINGLGGIATILMAAPGPAFHLVGTHAGTAYPKSVEDRVWQRQRMPTIGDIEIAGRHEQASGLLLEGVMAPTIQGVLLRQLLDGIRLFGRCRNVVISECQIYNNRGVGVFLDRVNLHQAIISASHISYNRVAGICISGSEIRNLQITGNDIEYNYAEDVDGAADVLIDCTAEGSTVREATISSNTIQASYSPNGANVRVVGYSAEQNQHAGMLTISGNLIGSQQTNVHLKSCRSVVVTGNVLYSGHDRNLLVEGARNIVVGPNSFDHNPGYRDKEICTGIRIVDSENLQLTGSVIQDAGSGQTTVLGAKAFPRLGLLEVVRSRRIGISACQVLDGSPTGIYVEDSSDVLLTGSTIATDDATSDATSPRANMIRWQGAGEGNLITGCRICSNADADAATAIDKNSGVVMESNLIAG